MQFSQFLISVVFVKIDDQLRALDAITTRKELVNGIIECAYWIVLLISTSYQRNKIRVVRGRGFSDKGTVSRGAN